MKNLKGVKQNLNDCISRKEIINLAKSNILIHEDSMKNIEINANLNPIYESFLKSSRQISRINVSDNQSYGNSLISIQKKTFNMIQQKINEKLKIIKDDNDLKSVEKIIDFYNHSNQAFFANKILNSGKYTHHQCGLAFYSIYLVLSGDPFLLSIKKLSNLSLEYHFLKRISALYFKQNNFFSSQLPMFENGTLKFKDSLLFLMDKHRLLIQEMDLISTFSIMSKKLVGSKLEESSLNEKALNRDLAETSTQIEALIEYIEAVSIQSPNLNDISHVICQFILLVNNYHSRLHSVAINNLAGINKQWEEYYKTNINLFSKLHYLSQNHYEEKILSILKEHTNFAFIANDIQQLIKQRKATIGTTGRLFYSLKMTIGKLIKNELEKNWKKDFFKHEIFKSQNKDLRIEEINKILDMPGSSKLVSLFDKIFNDNWNLIQKNEEGWDFNFTKYKQVKSISKENMILIRSNYVNGLIQALYNLIISEKYPMSFDVLMLFIKYSQKKIIEITNKIDLNEENIKSYSSLELNDLKDLIECIIFEGSKHSKEMKSQQKFKSLKIKKIRASGFNIPSSLDLISFKSLFV